MLLHEAPDDYGSYAEWLMANAEVYICGVRDLVDHLKKRTRYDEFLRYKESLDGGLRQLGVPLEKREEGKTESS